MKFPFQLKNECKFDVVGFGVNAQDHLIRVPRFPEYASKVEFTAHTQSPGGEVASTLVGLQRLGLATAYVGRFGCDEAGEAGIRSLVEESVDIAFAETVPNARTQIAFILIDDRSGERTVIWHRDENLQYGDAEPPLEAASWGRVLHMTPHDTEACIKMAMHAKTAGAIVSLDIDREFKGVEALLPLVDICIASADFPALFLGMSDPTAALYDLKARFGCRVVGITLGDQGSVFLCGDRVIETAAFAVPGGCVDTTGAGDAFRTGFLYGLISARTVEETAKIANAVAALTCRGPGARAALPYAGELDKLLENT